MKINQNGLIDLINVNGLMFQLKYKDQMEKRIFTSKRLTEGIKTQWVKTVSKWGKIQKPTAGKRRPVSPCHAQRVGWRCRPAEGTAMPSWH